jgi:hypothetical protein
MEVKDIVIDIGIDCDKDKDKECPICLNDFDSTDQDTVILKCCKKEFHIECYIRCINQKKECPMCRNQIMLTNTTNIFPSILQTPLLSPPTQHYSIFTNITTNQQQQPQSRINNINTKILRPLCFISGLITTIIVLNSYIKFI